MQAKGRLHWLDAYKGVAILLIIAHHVFQYFDAMTVVTDYIKDFHVGMFFAASGVVIMLGSSKQGSIGAFVIKKAKRLLAPYFIFSLLSSLIKMAVLVVFGRFQIGVLAKELGQIFTIGNGPTWFLGRLFIIELLFALGEKAAQKVANAKTRGMLAGGGFALLFGLLCAMQPVESVPLVVVRSAIMGLLQLMVGYFGAKILFRLNEKQLVWMGLCCFAAGTAISFSFDTALNFKIGTFNQTLWCALVSVLIPMGLMMLLKGLTAGWQHKWFGYLEFCGMNSLIYLVVHPTVLLCITYPLAGKFDALPALVQVGASIAVYIFCVAVMPLFVKLFSRPKLQFMVGK